MEIPKPFLKIRAAPAGEINSVKLCPICGRSAVPSRHLISNSGATCKGFGNCCAFFEEIPRTGSLFMWIFEAVRLLPSARGESIVPDVALPTAVRFKGIGICFERILLHIGLSNICSFAQARVCAREHFMQPNRLLCLALHHCTGIAGDLLEGNKNHALLSAVFK